MLDFRGLAMSTIQHDAGGGIAMLDTRGLVMYTRQQHDVGGGIATW